ncbi:hypothetical protein AX16_005684 [Volvariella volvacea WC 439]|nr:hypothetical protein AX16_005684 [Volvariella volvacea WC 439]
MAGPIQTHLPHCLREQGLDSVPSLLTGPELDRLEQLLSQPEDSKSIEKLREEMRRRHFFVSQLSSSASRPSTYDDLLDAPATSKGADGDDTDANGVLTPAAIKQKLLHILATENNLNKTLYRSHAILRSDFEWFGPSLPHSSILTILKFFGMPDTWLSFYERFLQAPLRFKEDPVDQVRIRKRGTPISYALSVVCGEVVMFAMDFSVNQRAGGLFLYRMHDDLWLWDKDPKKCGLAWKEMQRFADLVGIKFNTIKTGSAVIVNPEDGIDAEEVKTLLPQGNVRWGLLVFDAEEERFRIDQEDVDHHIREMRRQLDATKSVFGWVNLYNKYMAFFLRNFGGRPAKSYGNEHIQNTLRTLARIQKELFKDTTGGVVGYLRGVLEKKFGAVDLPEGYFHLPITYGGLEIRNPLVELLSLPTDERGMGASSYVHQRDKTDKDLYRIAEEDFEFKKDRPKDLEFLSFEEYITLRETYLDNWAVHYQNTLERLESNHEDISPNVLHDIDELGISLDDQAVYERWTFALYGEGLLKHFGSVKVVDGDLIPVGMVEVFRNSRMKLDE